MSTTVIERASTHAQGTSPTRPSGQWTPRQIEPGWWGSASHRGRPLSDALRCRDVTAVFRFLKTRGWSSAAIGAATGLSENRVRAVVSGSQKIISYDVLERIAQGLHIDRGLMGLAYDDDA